MISPAFRRVVGLLATSLILASTAVAQSSATGLRGFTLSPLMFRSEIPSGGSHSLAVEVQNLEPTVVRTSLRVQSATFDDWTYRANLGQAHERDCSRWFRRAEFQQSVRPNTGHTFRLQLDVPRAARGVYWCMLSIVPVPDRSTGVFLTEYQVPVILFVGQQPRPGLKLGEPSVEISASERAVQLPFENTGDAFLIIGASGEIRDRATGKLVQEVSERDRNLYPHTRRNLRFPIPTLPDGDYFVVVRPQAGTRVFPPMRKEFSVRSGRAESEGGGRMSSLAPFTMEPQRLRAELPAGGRRALAIKLTNDGAEAATIELKAMGVRQNETGAFQSIPDGPSGSLSVEVSPGTVTVPAGRSVSVRLNLGVAADATGDHWFAVSARGVGGTTIAEEMYGSVIVPNSAKASAKLGEPEVEFVKGVPLAVSFTVANTGNVALMPIYGASVLEKGVTSVAQLQVPRLGDGGLLAGNRLRYRVMLPATLKPGAYLVSVSCQYGERMFDTLRVPIKVPVPLKAVPKTTKGKTTGRKG